MGPAKFPPNFPQNFPPQYQQKVTDELLQEHRENISQGVKKKVCKPCSSLVQPASCPIKGAVAMVADQDVPEDGQGREADVVEQQAWLLDE